MRAWLEIASAVQCLLMHLTLANNQLKQVSSQVVDDLKCRFPSFYIENNAVVEGKLLEYFESLSLNECGSKCAKHESCNAANFVLSLDEKPMCMLVDRTKNGSLIETPSSSIYALRSYCLDKEIACSSWSYEKFAKYDLINEQFLLGAISDVEISQCLNSCSRLRYCEAVLYNSARKECRLSRVNLNNVNGVRHYFVHSNGVDLYENNCPKRQVDTSNCGFTRINQAGFVDVFDVRLDGMQTLTDCEARCSDWQSGVCRSYTYNKQQKQCFLSHASQKALGRSVLESLGQNLVSGEIDDCIKFELDCQGKQLILKGHSLKLFKGKIYTRKNKQPVCEHNVTEDYSFEAEFLFDKCNIRKQNTGTPIFAGLIFVKEGSTNLITIHDKVLDVKCQIHDQRLPQQDMRLSFHFEIEDQNSSISLQALSKTKFEKYKLEVLNADGEITTVADMHRHGYLMLTAESNTTGSFFPTSLIAQDSFNQVELIDPNGCVTNTKLIQSLERLSESKFRIEIVFDGFPDQSSVTYQTLIKPCTSNCDLDCNREFYKTNDTLWHGLEAGLAQNQLQSLGKVQTKRHVSLNGELYRVKRTVLSIKDSEDMQELFNTDKTSDQRLAEIINFLKKNHQPDTAHTSLEHPTAQTQNFSTKLNVWQECFTDNVSCVLTTALTIVQILLIILCSFLLYKYIKKLFYYYQRDGQNIKSSTFGGNCRVETTPENSQTPANFNHSYQDESNTVAIAQH